MARDEGRVPNRRVPKAGLLRRAMGALPRLARAAVAGIVDEEGPYPVSGTGRRSRSWRVRGFGPNNALTFTLSELRNKSRDQVRKNPYAASAVDSLVSNIIGTGIKPQWTIKDEKLREQLHQLWADWTDEADATGAFDFYGLQAVAVRGMVEGGDTLTRLRTRLLKDGLTVPLQLQVFEGEHCPHLKNDAAARIFHGVKHDAIGKRTAYLLYQEHPGDSRIGTSPETSEVPAEQVCHLYRATRPGQVRGEPWLTRALRTLLDLDAYLDAELVRKKNSAMFVAFIKRIMRLDEEPPINPVTGQVFSPLGADDADAAGAASMVLEPGMIQVLGDNEEVQFSDPKDVGQNFEPFVRQNLRAIAVAAGTLYELLTGDYGDMNDRSLRAALNDFRRKVEMWQHQLVVYQWCRPIVRRWVDLAILSGAIVLPAGVTPRDLYRVKWIPQAWPYIQPVQDITAQKDEIAAGLSSRAQKVSERGYDVEQIDAENAADNARADRLGLAYTSDGRNATKSGTPGQAPVSVPPEDPEQEPAPPPVETD